MNFLNNSVAPSNKTRVLRQITPENSPENSAKSLSHKFFGVPFLSLIVIAGGGTLCSTCSTGGLVWIPGNAWLRLQHSAQQAKRPHIKPLSLVGQASAGAQEDDAWPAEFPHAHIFSVSVFLSLSALSFCSLFLFSHSALSFCSLFLLSLSALSFRSLFLLSLSALSSSALSLSLFLLIYTYIYIYIYLSLSLSFSLALSLSLSVLSALSPSLSLSLSLSLRFSLRSLSLSLSLSALSFCSLSRSLSPSIYIYIYIYAVKLLTGPRLGFLMVTNWAT